MNIEQVWPEWKSEKIIGRGSFGTVYKCFKETENGKEYSAIKVISVPRDDYETTEIDSESMTREQSKTYYKEIADECLSEIKILESLKDSKNIVNIYDSKVVEKEDGIGWSVFIRMELLTDFNTYVSDKKFTADDVKRFALDICNALIVCGEKRIIHRDIKPENIFVDDEGNYKLGDFGVAKQMEKTYASSIKGALNYIAPEVLKAKKYDSRADIYSLGLVMYKLLNNNRLPFLDPNKQIVKHSERQQAFERRINGEKVPPIPAVDEKMNEIVLKACEYKPENRYRNVAEMKEDLESKNAGNKGIVKLIKKHKVVSAIAMLLVIAIVSGSVFWAEKKKSAPTETNYSFVDPTEKDWDELDEMYSFWKTVYNQNKKFDCTKIKGDSLLMTLTSVRHLDEYEKFFGKPEEIEENDPLNKFETVTKNNCKYSLENINWIIKNIYNVEPISKNGLDIIEKESTQLYCQDNFCYISYPLIMPVETIQFVTIEHENHKKTKDGKIIVYLKNISNISDSEIVAEMTVGLKMIDGKHYWSLYQIKPVNGAAAEENDKKYKPKDFYVDSFISYNGYGIINNEKNLLRIIDEKTGEEIFKKKIGDYGSESAFDGKTVYFTSLFADNRIKISADETTDQVQLNDKTDDNGVYLRSAIYRYDISAGIEEKVFEAYSNNTHIVYFDDNNLYFSDINESNMGNCSDSGNGILLYRFDLKTKELTAVLNDIWDAEFGGYKDNPIILFQTSDALFSTYGTTLGIYNLSDENYYRIDEDSRFRFADGERIYYEGDSCIYSCDYFGKNIEEFRNEINLSNQMVHNVNIFDEIFAIQGEDHSDGNGYNSSGSEFYSSLNYVSCCKILDLYSNTEGYLPLFTDADYYIINNKLIFKAFFGETLNREYCFIDYDKLEKTKDSEWPWKQLYSDKKNESTVFISEYGRYYQTVDNKTGELSGETHFEKTDFNLNA